MLQQIADRHRLAIGATPIVEERGDAIVEPQTARGHQLHHDRRGRQNLGERGQVERRVDRSRERTRSNVSVPTASCHSVPAVDPTSTAAAGKRPAAIARPAPARAASNELEDIAPRSGGTAADRLAEQRHRHRGGSANEHVPGERDARPAPDDRHRHQTGEHAGKCRRLSVMDGASVPSRNAPSTDPDAYDSTARPASSTDRCIHCAPTATPICTTPQTTVQMPRHAHQGLLVGVRPLVFQVEVVDRRRRHRIEGRRQGGRHDRRDDEAGGAVGERGDDEDRQQLVRARRADAAAARADSR